MSPRLSGWVAGINTRQLLEICVLEAMEELGAQETAPRDACGLLVDGLRILEGESNVGRRAPAPKLCDWRRFKSETRHESG